MRYFISFIFLVCFIQAGQAGSSDNFPVKKTTAICGNVSFPATFEANVVLFNDPLLQGESHFFLAIQGDHSFSLDIDLSKAQFAEFQYGEQSAKIWLEPGKDLNISFNGQQLEQSVEYFGSNAPANTFLQRFQAAFPDLAQKIEANMAIFDAETYKKYILKLAEERRDFIQNDHAFRDASEEFQLLFSKTENFWMAYQLLRFAFDKPLFDGNWEPLQLPDTYYDFLNRMHVSTSGLLDVDQYRAFLDKYIDLQKLKPEFKGFQTLELAHKFLKGEALWYFQAKDLVIKCRSGKATETEIKQFLKDCQNTSLKEAVENTYKETRGVAVGSEAPNFGLTDIDGNMVSLSDLKGKVVYLDFYATWCGHCMEEMPNLQRLPPAFEGKEVAVVFISFDKNPIAWKEYVKNAGLKGTHLWAESLNHSTVSKMYGVKALPASFLIGRDGKIIKAETGGTSVEEITQLIENQLDKK